MSSLIDVPIGSTVEFRFSPGSLQIRPAPRDPSGLLELAKEKLQVIEIVNGDTLRVVLEVLLG